MTEDIAIFISGATGLEDCDIVSYIRPKRGKEAS
jgi:hypothetical protein